MTDVVLGTFTAASEIDIENRLIDAIGAVAVSFTDGVFLIATPLTHMDLILFHLYGGSDIRYPPTRPQHVECDPHRSPFVIMPLIYTASASAIV